MLISKPVLNSANFSKIILDPMFEKVFLNNVILGGGTMGDPNSFLNILDTY